MTNHEFTETDIKKFGIDLSNENPRAIKLLYDLFQATQNDRFIRKSIESYIYERFDTLLK